MDHVTMTQQDLRLYQKASWQAGVREYWLVDARTDELVFRIHHRGQSEYAPAPTDDDRFQFSAFLNDEMLHK
jgi:hypothetical protein